MRFIDTIRKTNLLDGKINIVFNEKTRLALNIKTNSKLYVFPVRAERNGIITYQELVFSQQAPHKWKNLFRLRFWAVDKSGVITKIFKRLSSVGINISTQESIMTKYHDHFFTISLVADFSDVFNSENIKAGEEHVEDTDDLRDKAKRLRDYLKNLFSDMTELKDYTETADNPTVKPLRLLNYYTGRYKSDSSFNNTSASFNDILCEDQKKYFSTSPDFNELKISDDGVSIEKKITDEIRLNHNGNIYYTVNSDTEEKYIIVRFFDDTKHIVQLDVVHTSNEVGILHKVAKEISQRGFNIINSYDRIQDSEKTSHWVVMIDCTSKPDEIMNLIKTISDKTYKEVGVVSATESFINEESKLLGEIEKYQKNNGTENQKKNEIDKEIDQLRWERERDKTSHLKTVKYIGNMFKHFIYYSSYVILVMGVSISLLGFRYIKGLMGEKSGLDTFLYSLLIIGISIIISLIPLLFIKRELFKTGTFWLLKKHFRKRKLRELKKQFDNEFERE